MWDEYDRWTDALADVVFPELEEPQPVYLDFEDEMVAALALRMGCDPAQVEPALLAAVSATLGSRSANLFVRHDHRLTSWTRRPDGPPPVLPLLAAFSIAAERMSRGDGFSASNYVGRLEQTLSLAPGFGVGTAYRKVAELYWGALNRWLTQLQGQRGLPTAYSLGFRYVGLPISQALVRAADRERLNGFFRRFGFAPRSEVAAYELEEMLDSWMSQQPCPATQNLQRLWKKNAARLRIAQAVSVALAAWDGHVSDDEIQLGGASGVKLSLELGGFPTRRLGLNIVVYASRPTTARSAHVLTADHPVTIDLVPTLPGALGMVGADGIEPRTLLEGILNLEDGLTGESLVRRPRRVVVFRQDELSMRWIEIDQVQLTDDVSLLVEDTVMDEVIDLLGSVARPGWRAEMQGSYAGQPEGWVLITGVQILSHPPVPPRGLNDLSALVPLTTNQIRLTGGFLLPGVMKKWHSADPPELLAVSDAVDGFTLRVVDLSAADEGELVLVEVESSDGVVVETLSTYELGDGDYRVELVPVGETEARTTTTFHLRSADTPDLAQWSRSETLAHSLTGEGVMSASNCTTVEPFLRGALLIGGGEVSLPGGSVPPATPWWKGAASPPQRQLIQIARPDPGSCIYTGSHYEKIDYVPVDPRTGQPLSRWSVGRCSGCGIVRRYPTRLPRHGSSQLANASDRTTASVRDLLEALAASGVKLTDEQKRAAGPEFHREILKVHDLRRLSAVDDGRTRRWDIALDVLFHLGGGTWSSFEKVALQVESSNLFVDQMGRSLEALGHVEIMRDPKTMRAVAWESSPTALAETADGWVLVGHWPGALTSELVESVAAHDGEVQRTSPTDAPDAWFVAGLGQLEIAAMSLDIDEGIGVAPDLSRALLLDTPPLSAVLASLTRRALPEGGRLKWFDAITSSWVDTSRSDLPGAYRISGFTTVDFFRTEADVAAGEVAVTTVQLSKHLSASMTGRPLLAYDPRAKELVVPLGADLPGLYGRAAVLASGELPEPDRSNRLLRYKSVPADIASCLFDLLRS